jgi:hypothetical protein
MAGYYLDDGYCKKCSTVLSGCLQCRSADVCTVCGSEFLTIDQGRCICREGIPNQFQNLDTGACECIDGYYMTSTGCQTCEYMIPYCEKCTIGTQDTGYELYSAAQFLDTAFYLGCSSCAYGRYLEQKKGT